LHTYEKIHGAKPGTLRQPNDAKPHSNSPAGVLLDPVYATAQFYSYAQDLLDVGLEIA